MSISFNDSWISEDWLKQAGTTAPDLKALFAPFSGQSMPGAAAFAAPFLAAGSAWLAGAMSVAAFWYALAPTGATQAVGIATATGADIEEAATPSGATARTATVSAGALAGESAPAPAAIVSRLTLPKAEVAAPVVSGSANGAGTISDADKPKGLKGPRSGGPDDLKMISGVGPKIEGILNGLGIFHFDQVAAWTGKEVAWVDKYLKFNGRIVRDDWIAQADALAAGGADEYLRRFGKAPR